MSPAFITTIVGSVILCAVLIVVFLNMRQKANDERIRKTIQLKDRYRRLKRLVTELPPQYVNKEIRGLVIKRAQETINEIIQLKDEAGLRDELVELQVLAEQKDESNDNPPPVNAAQSKEIRNLLKILYRFTEAQQKNGRLDKKSAKTHLEHTAFMLGKSVADAHIAQAKASEKQKKYRIAIHHYHDAVAAFAKLASNPHAQKTAAGIKKRMAELEKLAAESTKEASATTTQSEPQDNTLEQQWEELDDKDDDWKKKNAYD